MLTVKDGVADVAAKTFSEKQALSWILKRLETDKGNLYQDKMLISVEVGDRDEWKKTLKGIIEDKFPEAEIYELEMSPVVTCHTGPGLWGVSYLFP